MKKIITRIAALALVAIMAISFAACGKKGEPVSDYKVDEVKQKLAEVLKINESKIKVEDLPAGTVLAYSTYGDSFACYIVDNPKDAPEHFEAQTLGGTYSDKRIDKKNHKLWVEGLSESSDGTPRYEVLAIKGNLVLSISSTVEPETIIDTFDLN